jgi:enoyl-CoA hydratase/carnithine racemase
MWLHLLARAARALLRTSHFGLTSHASGPVRPKARAQPVKESVNRAFESSLNQGLLFERHAFHASFGLEDQKEGMAAFAEKRKANFRNR